MMMVVCGGGGGCATSSHGVGGVDGGNTDKWWLLILWWRDGMVVFMIMAVVFAIIMSLCLLILFPLSTLFFPLSLFRFLTFPCHRFYFFLSPPSPSLPLSPFPVCITLFYLFISSYREYGDRLSSPFRSFFLLSPFAIFSTSCLILSPYELVHSLSPSPYLAVSFPSLHSQFCLFSFPYIPT